ncbi:MAG: PEP-CTERM sorting domain-containing protein [Nostoc sp. EfeVER01]|uniref:PEP-CTERM sorting domain-containing protein n=1 Tax=unclassified Nostoc TaxID=2593658 RepID=UPI002AD337FD|nr:MULTISPECIES: PEP-CTERM sorting domain-containing protein [unclassified Nostoc]MDZ7949185.1 PEP-CTERM sorting domain-containing protein [Nostoc sp. EfeVER01]MDZ7994565.1 PEP-CTERM sorting domain-containing protein [Nostoc sp. EspVER01]
MKLAKDISVAVFAVAISVAAVVKPTQAALVNYDFTVNATSGDRPGQYFGSFQYDDSTLTNTGLETLGVENGLVVAFNYLGTNYTEVDDTDFNSFPIASFNNGKILGLSYFIADQFAIASDPNTPDVGGNNFYLIDQSVNTTQVGTVSYAKVPEPLAVGGTAFAAVMGLWMQRKKRATKVMG